MERCQPKKCLQLSPLPNASRSSGSCATSRCRLAPSPRAAGLASRLSLITFKSSKMPVLST
ncbi:UNVERIFIED_CONTAM: hypothetical protein GTU68_028430 [Idotea baltica]|nr:hypothetical protein [Idotea baltica]